MVYAWQRGKLICKPVLGGMIIFLRSSLSAFLASQSTPISQLYAKQSLGLGQLEINASNAVTLGFALFAGPRITELQQGHVAATRTCFF